jgi:tetratricopeptide (TPR) repeat protein
VAQSPEQNAGTSEVIRYDLGWNAINALLRSGRSLSGHERNCCFLNTGGESFANVSAATGLDYIDDGRVLALADWDHDGDVDFWVANRSGPQIRYLRNNLKPGTQSVAFRLEGTNCNRNAIGARITLRWNGQEQVQTHTVRAGDGYLAQSSRWVHFGLGGRRTIDEVHVRWPDGAEQVFRDVAAGRWYRVTEGDPSLATWAPPKWPPLEPSELGAPPLTDRARIVLLTPIPLPELQCVDGERNEVSALKGVNRARLINVWASWCQPCLEELSQWKEHRRELADAGLEIVAVNVDEDNLSETSAARSIADALELPFTLAYGSPELVARLDAIQRSLLSRQRPLPVPSSFLIDADGQLRVVYKGPVSIETLLRDAELLDAPRERILEAAMPFAGEWLEPPPGSTPLQIVLTLVEAGDSQGALAYAEDILLRHRDNRSFISSDLWNLVGAMRLDNGRIEEAAAAFSESLALEPNNRQANIELGVLLLRAGQGGAAEPHFRKVLSATPDDTEQRYNLGVALLLQGKLDGAKEQLQAVVNERGDALAYWQLGNVYVGQKDASGAIEAYDRAISLKPELVRSANNLAWLLATSAPPIRDGVRAVEIAEQICSAAANPTASQLDTLAAAYAATGQFDKAVAAAKEAIRSADATQDEALKQRIESRLELYRAKQPFYEVRP